MDTTLYTLIHMYKQVYLYSI